MADVLTKYGKVGAKFANKEIDLDSDTIKAFLLKSSYTPDMDAHEYEDDLALSTNEISTTSTYTKGTGVTLANKSMTYDSENNYTKFDADDITIEDATAADIMYLALVDTQSGVASTNPLIALLTFDAAKRVLSAQQLKVTWNASGILAI